MENTPKTTATVYIIVCRKPGTTFEHFKSYYEGHHIPLVTKLVMKDDFRPVYHTRDYLERDANAEGKSPSFPFGGVESWDYDCITRMEFRDTAHRDACFAEFGKHREEIVADEENFADHSKIKMIFVSDSPTLVRQ